MTEEIRNIQENTIVIEDVDNKQEYSKEILLSNRQIKQLEKEGKITIKDGQDIKSKSLKELFNRENILYFGKFEKEMFLQMKYLTGKFVLPLITKEDL